MKKISLEQIKHIRSLRDKNTRKKQNLFWVEGQRNIKSILESGLSPQLIVISNPELADTISFANISQDTLYLISNRDVSRVKSTKTFPGIGAVFPILKTKPLSTETVLALDKINDPGNMGTILRTALWFGVKDIIIDELSCDPFNEKVIRSSMGAIASLNIIIIPELSAYLKKVSKEYTILCADMKGSDVSKLIPGKKIILMGNEAHGISPEVRSYCTELIHIPGSGHQESLNVAVAAGIILYNQVNKRSAAT